MRSLCNLFMVVKAGRTKPKTKYAAILFGSMMTASSFAANVYTCADATFAGKPVWPAIGACTGQLVPAGPNLVVATADAAWSAQVWKQSADILPTDHVFTDTKDAAGSAWALGSAFVWSGAPSITTGTVHLSWTPPNQRTDNTPFTPAGFKIYSAATQTTLGLLIRLADPKATSYDVSGLAVGSYDFAVTAFELGGFNDIDLETDQSNVITKNVTKPVAKGKAPTGLSATVTTP